VVESWDSRPSSQCIFVRVRPSCFLLVKMCLCLVSRLSRFFSLLSPTDVVYATRQLITNNNLIISISVLTFTSVFICSMAGC
jgi:hypothetical protein